MSISPRSGGRGSTDFYVWNIIMHWNGNVDSLYSSALPKIQIIRKNALNKICWKLNFLQKTQWAHMSISCRSKARGLLRLPCLKQYNVLKWESRFTLRLSAAKNMDNIKKMHLTKILENLSKFYFYLISIFSKLILY